MGEAVQSADLQAITAVTTDGIGYLMLQAIPRMQTDFVFAQVIVLTIMSAVLLATVIGLERLVCPWNKPTEGTTTL